MYAGDYADIWQAALLIFLAEIGDKTFFVAVLLSAKYSAMPVFVGCMLALAASTVLAALVGYLLASFISPTVLTFVAAGLFLGFAIWLIWEWYVFDESESAEKEAEEEVAVLAAQEGYGSLHDDDDAPRSSTDPPSSQQCSPPIIPAVPWWRVVALAFSMNFIGELGDKTQIAVAVQASTNDPFLTAVGALIGFFLVTTIAVLFGKAIAKFLSPRALLLAAAAAFCLFGVLALIQGVHLINKADADTQFLHTKMVTGALRKSLGGGGGGEGGESFPKDSVRELPLGMAPVRGTSWSFHSIFVCGLGAGVLVAVVIVLIWRYCMKTAHERNDSGAASSWEPLPDTSDLEYAPATLHLFSHRCGWLVALLLIQSLSAEVLESFKVLLRDHPNIVFFLTMLVGAGGNSGAQSAVLAVRQMALKQRVSLPEQLVVGCKLAAILFIAALLRCVFIGWINWPESYAIAGSLAIIVMFAVLLGTALPLILDRASVDPAHSIAIIQVVMDIFGVCITCFFGALLLDYVIASPHDKF